MPQPPPPLLSPTAVPLPTLLPAHSHLMTVSKCDTSPHVSDSGEPAVMRRRWCCVGGGAFANTPAAAEDAVLELAGAAEKDAPRRTGEPVACCSTAGAVVGVACLFSMALAPCCCRCKHCTSCRRRLRSPHVHFRCAGIEICTARGLKGLCHLVATLCFACGSQCNAQYPLACAALPPLTWHPLPRQHPDCRCPHHHCRDRRRRAGAATCAGNAGMVSRRSSRWRVSWP